MKKVVGIRFKSAGKIYNFDSGAFVLKQGDNVIVETEKGLGYGMVAVLPTPYAKIPNDKPLKKVFRIATENDHLQVEKNMAFEKNAYAFCLDCIKNQGLKMNLFSVESTFDASRLTFFFTADGRVDFRELVKNLVKKFRVRIEMRQVGIRNQAKMCGGIGRCGRELCCSAFIEKFEPVSIKMAKQQGLSLNPTKISGQCGRLMCCLTYENQTYLKLKENFPKIGKIVKVKDTTGKVVRHNVIRNKVVVRLENGTETEIGIGDIVRDVNPKKKKDRKPKQNVR
jgi:cell fate regulator YaaT (PSP1 superfamily)